MGEGVNHRAIRCRRPRDNRDDRGGFVGTIGGRIHGANAIPPRAASPIGHATAATVGGAQRSRATVGTLGPRGGRQRHALADAVARHGWLVMNELWMVTGRTFVAGFVIDKAGRVTRCAPILRRRGGTIRDQAGALRRGEGMQRIDRWPDTDDGS